MSEVREVNGRKIGVIEFSLTELIDRHAHWITEQMSVRLVGHDRLADLDHKVVGHVGDTIHLEVSGVEEPEHGAFPRTFFERDRPDVARVRDPGDAGVGPARLPRGERGVGPRCGAGGCLRGGQAGKVRPVSRDVPPTFGRRSRHDVLAGDAVDTGEDGEGHPLDLEPANLHDLLLGQLALILLTHQPGSVPQLVLLIRQVRSPSASSRSGCSLGRRQNGSTPSHRDTDRRTPAERGGGCSGAASLSHRSD